MLQGLVSIYDHDIQLLPVAASASQTNAAVVNVDVITTTSSASVTRPAAQSQQHQALVITIASHDTHISLLDGKAFTVSFIPFYQLAYKTLTLTSQKIV